MTVPNPTRQRVHEAILKWAARWTDHGLPVAVSGLHTLSRDLGWTDTLSELQAIDRGERDCARCGTRTTEWDLTSEETSTQFAVPVDSALCSECLRDDDGGRVEGD